MSRTRWIAAGLVVLIVFAAVIVLINVRDSTIGDTVEVTRGDIEVTVETVGRVEVRDQVTLRSPLPAFVNVVAVSPGDEVIEGDVLVQLDRAPFEEAIEEAEELLIRAETNLALIEAEGRASDASSLVERIAAQQQVREAEAQLTRAEAALGDSLVIAPIDGTIISVAVDEGDDVVRNAELIQIAGLREFQLVLDIDEVDLPLISRGADVRVVLEAYRDQVIESEIYSIARQAQMVGGTTVFPATVRFQAQEGLIILPGMNAEVEITTAVRQDVLLLPEGSFQTVGRRTFVDVVVNGDVERREIRTGVRSEGMVEIADGLDENDRVVIP
jgi:RND family efflux transporter MFP subunit